MALADDVQAVMGGGGPLARRAQPYRQREPQLRMAQAVAQAIEQRHALVVEAGTGVGKTYAYLVPLLLSGRKGLVSTATKSLQDQLFHRDLPRLCDWLAHPVRLALLKGRSSYLCPHRLEQARQAPEGWDRISLRQLVRVETWAQGTTSGDLSEVAGLDERSALWPAITSTRDNCLGSDCPSLARCFVMKARKEALEADVVVVNHHLYFADAALKEGGVAELLPSAEVVVFDEAHQILDTGLQFLATQVSTHALQDLIQDLRNAGLMHAKGLRDWASWAAAAQLAVKELLLAAWGPTAPQRGQRRVAWSERVSGRPEGQARPVEVAFDQALRAVQACCVQAQALCTEVEGSHPDWVRLAERAAEAAERLGHFLQPLASDRVRWIDLTGSGARLIDSPLDIHELTQAHVQPGVRTWIYTSATLGDEPSLEWFKRAAGLEGAATLCVGSPYDFANNARVWIPPWVPEPADPEHLPMVAQVAARVAARLGGRTFVLATTLRALPLIADGISALLDERGVNLEVWVQGQEPKGLLLERFLSAPSRGVGAILVGAHTFWEGIDVPGEALQCVVIDKLPFPPPDDPLLQARSAHLKAQGREPFEELFLAEAAIALKQGAGRLIRSETDRGLLVLCDKRLRTKGYGRRLLKALPPMTEVQDGPEVVAWLEGLRAPAAVDQA